MSNVPFPLPDKAGQGELYAQIHQLTREYQRLCERGARHEAKVLERRLDQARAKWHSLYEGKVVQHG